jgi:integration host factor subunit alpha
MSLTKPELIKRVSSLGFQKQDAGTIIENLLEIIKKSLENGEDVLISGFGKFSVKDKPPRRGRNPATGELLILDARRVVTFKTSGKLKERMNGDG